MSDWTYGDPVRDLETVEQVDEIGRDTLVELANGSYGLGNRFTVDWEVFYDMLENQYGWSLDEWDSPADRKIRRIVRKAVKEGDVS